MAGDPATVCVVCGPASMVVDVPRSLAELGISRDRIKLDEW
jgi:ferredoxin-NADP reductase